MAALADSSKQALNAVHNALVFNRRVDVLSSRIAEAIPEGGSVLDVGCGDGQIAVNIMAKRPDLSFTGVDIMVRPRTHIPVTEYDGDTLPLADKSHDYATIVDVLHHTGDPAAVLRETLRCVRKGVVIKDHLREGFLAGPTLRLMDWVGNRGHNVVLPYNYLSREEWDRAFAGAGCEIASWTQDVGIYPAPASWFFDRDLHFIALLVPKG